MELMSVNEKTAFNCSDKNLPVYTDCIHRRISKKTPPAIYHYHANIELLYCVSGELEVMLFSKSVVLKEGDFLYLAPNTPHATSSHSDTNEHICIKFLSSMIHVPSSRKIPPEDYYISLTPYYELFPRDEESHDQIRDLFFDCVENYSHDDYFKRLAMRADIMRIMAYVFKHSANEITEETPKAISDVFLAVLDYIDSNCSTITLEDAADFCSLSYSYFSRTFKSLFNISFSNYVIKKRIDKSLNLISGTNMSLNDIALECGFANLSHFIKCFNKEKGMTPKKFRAIVAEK